MQFLYQLATVILLGIFSPLSATVQQQQEKIIDKESWRKEPVKISKLKVKGKSIVLSEKFFEDDDWFKDLSVTLKNSFNKTIVYAEIEVMFPRPQGDLSPYYLYRLSYGRIPPPLNTSSLPNEPKHLKPGEDIEITLPAEDFAGIKATLLELGYPLTIERIKLSVGAVVFEDGTMWRADSILRRNPDNPDEWKVVEQLKDGAVGYIMKPPLALENSLGASFLLASFDMRKDLPVGNFF